jgi:F-type H+-transporting ATPase subunit epsilon
MPGIAVVVVTPEREVFSGDADMVVAHGVDGDVGILPNHAPMLIQLGEAPVRIIEGQRERSIQVQGGFLHVSPGEEVTRVDVLAERAEPANE